MIHELFRLIMNYDYPDEPEPEQEWTFCKQCGGAARAGEDFCDACRACGYGEKPKEAR